MGNLATCNGLVGTRLKFKVLSFQFLLCSSLYSLLVSMGVYVENDSTDEREDFHAPESDAVYGLELEVNLEVGDARVIVEESDIDSSCSYNIIASPINEMRFSMEEEL